MVENCRHFVLFFLRGLQKKKKENGQKYLDIIFLLLWSTDHVNAGLEAPCEISLDSKNCSKSYVYYNEKENGRSIRSDIYYSRDNIIRLSGDVVSESI